MSQQSTFVSVLAWIFILLAGFATFVAILQNLMFLFVFPTDMAIPEGDDVPPMMTFLFKNIRLYFLGILIVAASTFVSALGLLKRKEWARKAFVGILSLGIVYLIGTGILQHFIIDQMSSFGHPMSDGEKTVMLMIRVSTLFMIVGLGVLFGWIIKRLTSPEIKAEFQGVHLPGAESLMVLALFGLTACSDPVTAPPAEPNNASSNNLNSGTQNSNNPDQGVNNPNNNCAPRTCAELGATCGTHDDGCGNTVVCGTCAVGDACSPETHSCGPCAPLSCEELNVECGEVPNGCGGIARCGQCSGAQVCDRVTRKCVSANEACTNQGASCGFTSDACGNAVDCGGCSAGEGVCNDQTRTCGACQPRTCASIQATCGTYPDGCGGELSCGTCDAPLACDRDTRQCQPCQQRGCDGRCGQVSNGCGGVLNCGACPTNLGECGSGEARKCGVVMSACNMIQINCGGCGEGFECRGGTCEKNCDEPCQDPQVCYQGQCCMPTGCDATGATCGEYPDGCGGYVSCGECNNTDICSEGNCIECTLMPDVCANRQCGFTFNGCAFENCGQCPSNTYCSNGQCEPCLISPCTLTGSTCGVAFDNCGNAEACGDCEGAEACVNNTCCAPDPVCDTFQCGQHFNGCEVTSCGQCPSGQLCTTQGQCCVPAICDLSQCGLTIPNGCGGNLTCPPC